MKLVQAVLTSNDAAESRRCAAVPPEALLRHRLIVAAATIDHQLDVLAVHARRASDGTARRRDCQLDARDMRDAPLLHAGPRRDPGVIRGQKSGQILIGQY